MGPSDICNLHYILCPNRISAAVGRSQDSSAARPQASPSYTRGVMAAPAWRYGLPPCPLPGGGEGSPWWLGISEGSNGQMWVCNMCQKEACDEHFGSGKHRKNVAWHVQPPAPRGEAGGREAGGGGPGCGGMAALQVSPAGSTAASSDTHSPPLQAAAGPAAAAATAAAPAIDQRMEALASSVRALTLVTDNLANALERLSRQAMQLQTQFDAFGQEVAKLHEEAAARRNDGSTAAASWPAWK